ncbi:helix-turn-helix domain-containing protein [Micromonospora sp. C28SCA-DRY-2]|uniref:helix-turn-helix domain-containing protein n=1 Tax=Micromonospora sp. C28SCA-DRY-2 TaxID=3059522 RepID=UPI002677026E|nr:helix-turn-helix domain-containing protein [Micromonospora sp. C28SCA-DRY-2]MDO3703482.1 helix-turn-helix domain-containing protein [Micromonospora sp. C28SCA-DRY-2]
MSPSRSPDPAAGRIPSVRSRPGAAGPPPALPRHHLAVPDQDDLPFAVGTFDELGPLSRADFPHRHTFYELVYVTHGRAAHLIDLDTHPVRPPHLFVVTPGQVHQWRDQRELRGHVLLCTAEFLLTAPADRDALHRSGHRSWRPRDAAQARRIATLLRWATAEYHRPGPGRAGPLRAYLHLLLTEALRSRPTAPASHPPPEPPAARDRRAAAIARHFEELLADPDLVGQPPHAYARRIGVSVRHLNDAVPLATGTTPARLIRRARVLEAKRLLAGTDLTVAAIAGRLGFADPAYFCRFFRREVGDSPGAFRRHGGKHHDPVRPHIDGS